MRELSGASFSYPLSLSFRRSFSSSLSSVLPPPPTLAALTPASH